MQATQTAFQAEQRSLQAAVAVTSPGRRSSMLAYDLPFYDDPAQMQHMLSPQRWAAHPALCTKGMTAPHNNHPLSLSPLPPVRHDSHSTEVAKQPVRPSPR